MKQIFPFLALLLNLYANAQPSSKEIVAKNWKFVVPTNIKECNINGGDVKDSMVAQNKFMFRVVNILEDGNLVIKFLKWESKETASTKKILNEKFYYTKDSWGKINNSDSSNNSNEEPYKYFLLTHKKFDENCEEALPKTSFTVGALTLPVKVRFGNNKSGDDKVYASFSGNLSLGMSIGGKFRFKNNDKIALNLLTGFSLTSVPVTSETTKGFIETETNVAAVTWHAGVLFEIENFQVGLFTGVDYLSGKLNSQWDYKNKPWLGVGIGFSFFSNKSATETQVAKATP